jgi:hypothetical protein
MSAKRRTLDELLDAARARIARLGPIDAHAAAEQGALLIDIRGQVDRERDGIVPGSAHILRTVLESLGAPIQGSTATPSDDGERVRILDDVETQPGS